MQHISQNPTISHFDFRGRDKKMNNFDIFTSLTLIYLNSEDNEKTLNNSISLRVGLSSLLYVDMDSCVQ